MTNKTARALLHRHGLPEDVIDGALCLHAQELTALQRLRMEELDLTGQKARIVGRIVDLIDPARTPAAVSAAVAPPTNQTVASREAEAELYVLLRKAGEPRDEAQALIDRHRDEVLRRAELRRMADETATETPEPHRGDAFEQWLKARRDEWAPEGCQPWQILDQTLEEYRLHADTGTPLGEHVCEARVVGDCECLEQPAAGARQDGSRP